jgi:hypothetical protein
LRSSSSPAFGEAGSETVGQAQPHLGSARRYAAQPPDTSKPPGTCRGAVLRTRSSRTTAVPVGARWEPACGRPLLPQGDPYWRAGRATLLRVRQILLEP